MKKMLATVAVAAAMALPAVPAQSADIATTLRVMSEVNEFSFDTFIAAAEAVGLFDELADGGAYCSNGCTVFAPTDDAFGRLPAGTVETLLMVENRQQLREIIQHHILPRTFYRSNIASRQGESLAYDYSFLRYTGIATRNLLVGDAVFVRGDVDANNGVIHVIDSVITP